jgi:hypothetical protein
MILYKEALGIAKDYVAKIGGERHVELALLEDHTEEKPYGWIFWYQSERFVRERDPHSLYGIFDTPPFIVEKASGKLRYLIGRPQVDFPYDGEVPYEEAQIAYEDQQWQKKSTSVTDVE